MLERFEDYGLLKTMEEAGKRLCLIRNKRLVIWKNLRIETALQGRK